MDPVSYFKENKYVHIPQLVSKEITTFIYNYLILKSCTNRDFSEAEISKPKTYLRYCYGDLCSETLLGFLVDPVSNIVQKKLCPAYSYTRMYVHGEILTPHRDRPSCQYSVTINFGGDPWPIYFGKLNKERLENGYSLLNEITMQPGDGVVYMGEELVHWRNKFEGDHCAQSFLHFIDTEGPYFPEHQYDGRKNIGYLKGV